MLKSVSGLTVVLLLAVCVLPSCVTLRKYEELQTKQQRCAVDNETLKAENELLTTGKNELEVEMEEIEKRMAALLTDTSIIGKSLRTVTSNFNILDKTYKRLLKKQDDLLEMSARDRKKMLSQLSATDTELQKREDELKELSRSLDIKKTELEKLTTDLNNSRTDLEKREKRVQELETIIANKDAAVSALKNKVADALLGFKNKGLTVEQKNGKVYVSLEAKLLFSSGSTNIDKGGKEALVKLAKVLEEQEDIEVVVEGHTDSDGINSANIPRNNWELSVLRSTAVVQIMIANSKIEPAMLSAAGRSQYVPIDPDNKKKNRRIEIILTPNLDELFEMINKTDNLTKE